MESLGQTLEKKYGMAALPVFQNKYCVNASSFGFDCDRCVALCPASLFAPGKRSKNPDFSKCIKCGVCIAVCPAKAISPMEGHVRRFLMALGRGEQISIGCAREECGWTISCDCLAALSWEQIACAALKNGAVISLRGCKHCKQHSCFSQVMDALGKAKAFLGDDLFFEKVQLLEEGDSYQCGGDAISRRELFTFYKRLPLNGAAALLPQEQKGDRSGLFYRALLRDLVYQRYTQAPREARPQYTMPLPRIGDSCTACGTCVRMCPEKALAIQPRETGKVITVEAWKCTSCGKCVKACTRGAIDALVDMRIRHMGRLALKCLDKEMTV